MKKVDEKLAERVIREGHGIADKIRSAKSLNELEKIEKEVNDYSDFTDEEFGTEDYLGSGKYCGLSIRLRDAFHQKQKTFYKENLHDQRRKDIADQELELFEAYLDSRYWVIEIEEYEPPGPPTRQVDEKLVEEVISRGYEIADKIRNSKSLAELEALNPVIREYEDFVDEKFGVVDELDASDKPCCEISFYVVMAIENKSRHLNYYHTHPELGGNEGANGLKAYLNSKEWVHDWLKESAK